MEHPGWKAPCGEVEVNPLLPLSKAAQSDAEAEQCRLHGGGGRGGLSSLFPFGGAQWSSQRGLGSNPDYAHIPTLWFWTRALRALSLGFFLYKTRSLRADFNCTSC